MKNSGTQTQYTAVEQNNQLVLILNSEIKLPEGAPVRVASAQLEELDYRKLLQRILPEEENRSPTRE